MVEFVEDVHCYLNDGVIIPSVSDLIRFKFPDAYKGIPEWILKNKASYGTDVHNMIEMFVKDELSVEDIEDENIRSAVEQFEDLRKKWAFYIKDMEQIVSWGGRVAGKYDIRLEDDYLVDLKTTSKLHEDWLSWQLSLYYLCAGIEKDHGFCIWLPKGKKAKVVSIETIPKEELIQLIEDYEKNNSSN